MQSAGIEFLYGSRDGEVVSAFGLPDLPVLVMTTLMHEESGHPVLLRYLPAEAPDGRKVLMMDHWFCAPPGDNYGPRLGGIR